MALPPQNPPVGRHRVVIPNRNGENLVGILHEAGTTDIVIVCHGFGCSKDTNIILNLAVALENAKISSFRFDFSGNGITEDSSMYHLFSYFILYTFISYCLDTSSNQLQSTKSRESEGSAQRDDLWKEVDDLLAVAQHFRESNRNISAVVGHSKGGDIVLLYASKYRDIKTVVNISGCYDLNRTGSSDFRVTEESLMAVNMHDACLQIDKECSVLTIHGSSDKINPVEDAFEFAKIIPNHKLHVIEGAGHFFRNHEEELFSTVVNFIKESLHQVNGTACKL